MTIYRNAWSLLFVTAASFSALSNDKLYALEDTVEAVGVFDWIPLPATLTKYPNMASYRDHYIHSLKIETNAAGRYELTIQIPEDLSSGIKTFITLPEVWRSNEGNDFRFHSEKGTLECQAYESWMRATCKVVTLDLTGDLTARVDFVRQKYAGTRKENPLADVAFHTAAEPFGKIRFSDPEFLVEGATQANGKWQTQIQANDGSILNTVVYFDFDRGAYKDINQSVLIGGLFFTDNTVEGGWGRSDDDYGWFRLTIEGDHFTGTWGNYTTEGPLGTWIGRRLP